MPKEYSRALRIADQIQRELAELIHNELKDKRIGMITLTGVELSQDYGHAKIFYTTLGNAEDNFLTEKGLQHAAAFLRNQLSRRLRLRVVPLLTFIYDKSIEQGVHLSQLIDKAIKQDKQKK
ncbi:MAG: ribosome-binding factor A [Nitrosomonadaceae bacterium]|nr:ribosome-binding factor A [Nitrosomonadaceae bacterium]|tara:strand:+ start:1030 stop:1395 length:366 start_codon:yes stop_codon:yes gene_type:complete